MNKALRWKRPLGLFLTSFDGKGGKHILFAFDRLGKTHEIIIKRRAK